jgi:hypothetical protein
MWLVQVYKGVLEMNYRQGGSETGPLIVHPAGDTIPACT